MMSRQESVVHKVHTMELPIEFQHFLSGFCHFEEHQILVFTIVNAGYGGAPNVGASRAKHAL